MRRWTLSLLAAMLGVALCAPAMAQWKWRDKSGLVQYSDLPPPSGIADADILQRPNVSQRRAAVAAAPAASAASGAAATAASAPKGLDSELEAKRRKAEQEQQTKKKADDDRVAAIRAENCARARTQLKALDDGMRIARVNKDGEREVLDDKGRADETKRARDVAAAECK